MEGEGGGGCGFGWWVVTSPVLGSRERREGGRQVGRQQTPSPGREAGLLGWSLSEPRRGGSCI